MTCTNCSIGTSATMCGNYCLCSCHNKGTISYGMHYDGRDYLVCEQCDKNVKRMLEYGVVV